MALSTKERQQKYRNKLRRRVKGVFNFRCCCCFSTSDLEFAHKEQCFMGKGRGGTLRMRAIYNNPEQYLLLCHKCHKEYDNIDKVIKCQNII